MERINSLQSLVGYGNYGEDSEEEIEDSDDEETKKESTTSSAMVKPTIVPTAKKVGSRLVSYGGDEEDDELDTSDVKEEAEQISEVSEDSEALTLKTPQAQLKAEETAKGDSPLRTEQLKSSDTKPRDNTIQLPPEPPGRCSNSLQDTINNLMEKRKRLGYDLNSNIQNRKDFRNPSIYEKLIQFCGIKETGTNYPKDIFDPTCWKEESFYDNLAKIQKERDKAKQERAQVEKKMATKKTTIPAAASATASATEGDPRRKKTKWDQQPPSQNKK